MAGLYDRYVVPWLLNCACSASPIAHQRAKVVPAAKGRVLELGMGSGLNLPFYDPTKVSLVQAVEPSEASRRRAMATAALSGLTLELIDGRAEALPYED